MSHTKDARLIWVNIFVSADMLYWSDAVQHRIEMFDINTGTREVWLQFSTDVMPMDILIDGEFMYYVQYTNP